MVRPTLSEGAMTPPALSLWGGVECTVNRVGDQYLDQMERNGHAVRLDDLDRFAAMGLRTLRYPVLWERIAPQGIDRADWSWPDARLTRLRERGINPIVGLVHHGSGPRHTSLMDRDFPRQLAEYAQAVARRYPWVDAYTPVNEPLTTARFSGLYGHWYPHERSDRAFLQALLTECQATALAMRAIRQVNPSARLVQTEDITQVYSTPALRYQAEFENERRWLTFDLLCGRVTPDHPLWSYLEWAGADREALDYLADNPCPPDVMGLNYYVTSERFLDQRLSRYPESAHGGNGQHRYADVEAVRVRAEGLGGLDALLQATWNRYGCRLAITETHLGCRDHAEQLHWLASVWRAAGDARERGIPVEAVTVWSLLGAYDWDSLVTRDVGSYEPGVFDVRDGTLQPTALLPLVEALATEANGGSRWEPASGSGWWQRVERLIYPPVSCPLPVDRPAHKMPPMRPAVEMEAARGANDLLDRAHRAEEELEVWERTAAGATRR